MAYLPLSTANLPDPVIDPAQGASPEDYFNTVLYTGTTAAQSITGVGFQPDLTWLKSRSDATSHWVTDAVRTVSGGGLRTNTTDSEVGTAFTSFDSDGFSLNIDGSLLGLNKNGQTYVAWNWKAGTSFSNSAGTNGATVASNGSVNTTSGFSIVRFNSGASGTQSFKHGLEQRPDLCIFKEKDSGGAGDHWVVWEGVALNPAQSYGYLNLTNGFANDASQWSNTAPTSSIFTYNSGYAWSTSQEMIAYCFHSVEGFSKFGSYVGNGSADGPFVYTGFRPAFVLMKGTNVNQWFIYDTERATFNEMTNVLYPAENYSEASGSNPLDFTSNGFKLRTTSAGRNASGQTYIYMAFAENPFKYSNAR